MRTGALLQDFEKETAWHHQILTYYEWYTCTWSLSSGQQKTIWQLTYHTHLCTLCFICKNLKDFMQIPPYDIFSFLCNNNFLYNKVTTLNLLDCLFTVKRHHTTFITWIDYGFLHFIVFSQNTILHNLFTSYNLFYSGMDSTTLDRLSRVFVFSQFSVTAATIHAY